MTAQSSINLKYKEAAQHIQDGAWEAAMGVLQDLLAQYPDHRTEIAPLLEHVQMKAKLEKNQRVRGRSPLELALLNRKRLIRAGIIVLVGFVIWGGWLVVDRLIVPVQAQYAQTARVDALLQEAKQAIRRTDWRAAASIYETLLAENPGLPEAQKGLTEAERQLDLIQRYDRALGLLDAGNSEEALALFRAIQAEEPDYRDVSRRIAEIQERATVADLFDAAEAAYAARAFAEAVPLYVQIRQTNLSYQAQTVETHLWESYLALAEDRYHTSGLSMDEIDETMVLYQQALSLRPRDRATRRKAQMLEEYVQAILMMDDHKYERAVSRLLPLHEGDPRLLGGDATQALYDARLGYGQVLEQEGNLWAALIQYMAAADLPVQDVSKAKLRARTVGLMLTPTPTSTPTVTPTPTPDPVEELRSEIQALATPTPVPLEQFQGWIAFKSDRPGGTRSGIWVMAPDGSQQQPVTDPIGLYDHLKEQAKWSKDNQRRIWVESDGTEYSVAIYMWRYDLPPHWLDARVELLNNSAINYYPALSPDDQAIAFTSQRSTLGEGSGTYGDEIFILYLNQPDENGYLQPIRLTHNDWEWDKHPTFSPDGQTIAFWSNRGTGRAQIWAMNVDGSNQRNLSNNEWNDWDPVYIVPRRELPNPDPRGEQPAPGPVFDPSQFEAER